MRSDAALRTSFLWLLESDEALGQIEREQKYWSAQPADLERIREAPRGPSRKELAFGPALEGGLRSIETRIEWLEWAAGQLTAVSER